MIEDDWMQIPVDEMHRLVKGDKIRYLKINGLKKKSGYVQGEWKNKDDPTKKGLVMAFKPWANKKDDTFTIAYDAIEECEKKINPSFYFEFQYLKNQINS